MPINYLGTMTNEEIRKINRIARKGTGKKRGPRKVLTEQEKADRYVDLTCKWVRDSFRAQREI